MTEDNAGGAEAFKGLDPREAQAALEEELAETMVAEDEAKMRTEEKSADEAGDNPDAENTENVDTEIEWSEEDRAEHLRMVEALLFAAAEPLDKKSIADRLPAGADVEGAISILTEKYEHAGVRVAKIANKWRFVTAPDLAHILEKEKVQPRKLSRAALETLAIIAYHQPCTRADIEDVRGVAVSKGSLDQLLEIGWVRLRGKREAPGRPTLYGTSETFLEHFGLETVQDLPGIADLKAAGLLDARLPPGFSVPAPTDGDDEDILGGDEESAEFAQDFLEDASEDLDEVGEN
ncbi:MAG: SMC-Scp complex subunit ScpB [Pseudomonadota bacterium]